MHAEIVTKYIYFLAYEATGVQHTYLNTSYIEYVLRKIEPQFLSK